jgi:hypothetical protein
VEIRVRVAVLLSAISQPLLLDYKMVRQCLGNPWVLFHVAILPTQGPEVRSVVVQGCFSIAEAIVDKDR